MRVSGGHDATGEESERLDESAVDAAVREFDSRVEAFAVAAMFSVRNSAHERRVRERIRSGSAKPVTCSHELSSRLDAPRRALTAALNARLTPQIRHLLDALAGVLECEAIAAPLMIVKGDGTLMKAEVALEYPVETVLSGPAASVVGAGFLSGLEDFAVADMGGTTTDVAMVVGGRPVVRAEGAVIGGWRTMVEAVDVRTCGLGGDSEVHFDSDRRLAVGPRKAMPLSLLAEQFPDVLTDLRQLAAAERVFAALTSPEQRVKWWGAEGRFRTTHMESDLRPGGKWLMRGVGLGGKPFTVQGVYREIERPRLLAFTWLPSWQEPELESLVRLELQERTGVTTVRLTHSGLTTESSRAQHRGWPDILAWLQAYLERGS